MRDVPLAPDLGAGLVLDLGAGEMSVDISQNKCSAERKRRLRLDPWPPKANKINI